MREPGGHGGRAGLPYTMVRDVARLVGCESPSEDLGAVARSAEVVAEVGARWLGGEPERIVIDGCTHLRWRFGGEPRVLLLGHHDTVWPVGTLARRPFEVRDGVLRGPGCFDMKAGLVVAFHALAGLSGLDGVTVLVTGDEEPGSATSRGLIEDEARGCTAALVLEAAGPGGALKTARKGVSRYEVIVPDSPGAAVELARLVVAVAGLGDAAAGTTVTPTRMEAGPGGARFEVDARVWDQAEQDRVHAAMTGLPGAEVRGGPNRPPLAGAASRELFERASRLADRLGVGPLAEVAVGGASDGNFTAGVGTPTLDGLGAVGGGAHAEDEHVLVAELPRRARLLAALVTDLLTDARAATQPEERAGRPSEPASGAEPAGLAGEDRAGCSDGRTGVAGAVRVDHLQGWSG
ncbi:M20/M25/M40 family metallo-hydrolase [Nonomuraea sp. NPDC050328]|uniref:M20/M25/M40 family metallo-hydrolase n=1 Tax=Nonomuraea sp. NPDC050328 TaxID=3364361 RepID=UPI00379268D6